MSQIETDPFDTHLEAMFDEAAKPYRHMAETEAFTRQVTARLARPERFRFFALAAAGSLGALIAGSQLPRLSGLDSLFLGLPVSASPELAASVVMALMALGFAWILTRRGLG